MDFGLLLLILGWVFVLIWVPLVVLSQRKMHPKALFTLFFAEMWERFSFYGMRAFLILYMTAEIFSHLNQTEADTRSYGVYGAFNALLYAAPIIGGMLADRVMGFRRAIVFGAILMALGQFTLAANANMGSQTLMFFTGLAMLAVGNGFFKPNISSFLGTFYDRNDNRKDGAFTIFYMGINVGALLAPLTCGYLAREIHYSLGFLAAGTGMLLGLIVFWRNMRKYEDKGNPPNPEYIKKPLFLGLNPIILIIVGSILSVPVFSTLINAEGLTNDILIVVGVGVLGYLLYTSFTSEDRADGQRLLVFIALFFFHMLFWTLFEQAGGSLNILTDRYINTHGIDASQFQAVNPFYIIVFAPLFTWIWSQLSKRGIEPRTPIKFFFALLQMALGYFIIVVGARSIMGDVDSGALIPLVFLLFMYMFHTTGELSLSPVGLSVVTKLSPAKTVGFVMGTWFLSIAFGHKVAGYLGQVIAAPTAGTDKAAELGNFINVYMNWGVYVVLAAAAVLLLISPILKKWMHGVH